MTAKRAAAFPIPLQDPKPFMDKANPWEVANLELSFRFPYRIQVLWAFE